MLLPIHYCEGALSPSLPTPMYKCNVIHLQIKYSQKSNWQMRFYCPVKRQSDILREKNQKGKKHTHKLTNAHARQAQ